MTAPGIIPDALPSPAVGDFVFLPNRLSPDHPAHALGAEICSKPGRVVSIDDGWAMVDRGRWGQFGCPVGDLRPALTPREDVTR